MYPWLPVTSTRMPSSALRRDDDFWSVERLSVSRGRGALEPAQAHQPAKRLRVVPVLSRLGREVTKHEIELAIDHVVFERNVQIWAPEVAVPLRDLVLEDQVIAERVPRELAGEAMVLVPVIARVGEHERRAGRASGRRKPP